MKKSATSKAASKRKPKSPPKKPVSHERCNSPKRNKPGELCGQTAGNRTDHPGVGRCWLHAGRPRMHGRYSEIQSERIRELTEKFEADLDPLNVLPELAACRAIYQDYLERYHAYAAALLAWHDSWRPSGSGYLGLVRKFRTAAQAGDIKTAETTLEAIAVLEEKGPAERPTQMLDAADAYRILSEVTKIVERIHKTASANHVTRENFLRVMQEMGRSTDTRIKAAGLTPKAADDLCAKISEDWLAIKL